MSTVKSKQYQIGNDASASNNFTIYQPATPDGTLRIGYGNADNPTEVGRFNANGYKPTTASAFSAYASANQSLTATTWTKLALDTEIFDVNNDFDTATYRFQPNVAGYYQINANASMNVAGRAILRVYKNGSGHLFFGDIDSTFTRVLSGSAVTYLNGSTDYLELYGWRETTGDVLGVGSAFTQMSATLIQQA